MDEATVKTLTESGWTEDREFDIQPYLNAFEKEKIEPLPNVLEFLKSFGDLKIYEGLYEEIHFDPIRAIASSSMKHMEYYERLGKRQLCPVGLGRHGNRLLLMDAKGKTYGTFDLFFLCYGEDLDQFLRRSK